MAENSERAMGVPGFFQHEGHDEDEGREGGCRGLATARVVRLIWRRFAPFVLLRGLRVQDWYRLKASSSAGFLPGGGAEN
jgi:hypothetical protein